MKLLCLSEDESLNTQIQSVASEMKWDIKWVLSDVDMKQGIDEFDPDLLLVDVTAKSGQDWWAGKSIAKNAKPVVLLDWEAKEDFVISALEAGADGCLAKPFSPHLFAAKVKALARRQTATGTKRHFPEINLTLDAENSEAQIKGKTVYLTQTEFKILRELSLAMGTTVARAELHAKVYGRGMTGIRSMDVHICTLRKKFRPLGLEIEGVRGVGYVVKPCRN